MRELIINADGYGFTGGITRAIEECIAFGTVRSVSVNVNFPSAERLAALVRRHPELSAGCHINPVVGSPVLPRDQVASLLNDDGEFLYERFARALMTGKIRFSELRREMIAQVEKTKELAGPAFSHVDFHMGLHRLPKLYGLFLDVAQSCGAPRIRTHVYQVGLESAFPRLRHLRHLAERPSRALKLIWNYALRRRALRRSLAMPARRVEITHMVTRPERINTANYVSMLRHLPPGVNEFVAHPAYVDSELGRWSSYLEPRARERQVLMDPEFRSALTSLEVRMIGYHDIPLVEATGRRSLNKLPGRALAAGTKADH